MKILQGNLITGPPIVVGNITWDAANFFASTADFSMSSVTDFNVTSSTGNINFIATGTGGQVNLASDGTCTFGSISGAFSLTANTDLDLTATTGAIQLNSATELLANTLKFGASNEAAINYSTNLIVNPAVSGTGYVFIGDGATTANLRANQLGLGTDAPAAARLISATLSSSSVSTGMVLDLTYTGTAGAMRAMNFVGTHTGTSANPSVSSLFTSKHTVDPTGTVTVLGIQAQAQAAVASTQGTKIYVGFRATPSDGGFTHTGGTVRHYGFWAQASPAFAGGATVTTWGGMFEDDVQIITDKKLIFEGTATVKGDTYMSWDGTSLNTYINNTNSVKVTATQTGVIAGSSSSYAKVAGVIDVNTTAVGNVGTGEDDLISYTIPANVLNTNGDSIRFRMAGTFAANVNNKRLKVKYGATTLFDTTALAFNGADWTVTGQVVRTGAATQKAVCQFSSGSVLLMSSADYTAPAETLSGTVVLKCTGEATSDNDITEEFHIVEWVPNE